MKTHFFSLFFREKVRFRAKIFHIGSGCIEGIFLNYVNAAQT